MTDNRQLRTANVILPLPLRGTFSYTIPEHFEGMVKRGVRVAVPFGAKRQYVGVVESLSDTPPEGVRLKPIADVIDREPVATEQQLRLWQWISEYYMSPIGDVLTAALPGGMKQIGAYKQKTEICLRLAPPFSSERGQHDALNMLGRAQAQHAMLTEYLALTDCGQTEITRDELLNAAHQTTATLTQLIKRGILETFDRPVSRLNDGSAATAKPQPLSPAQQEAYNQILFSFLKKNVCLLHGVTSSGKTEIYIHLISQQIQQSKQVLYLLPEIALTVQMMQRLRRVFGPRLGIYHSKYSDAERVEIWQKQLSAQPYDIILGARSALFLPFQRLGLVIIDEEHEQSFKQQEPAPRYHARSAAIMLAQMYGAKTLLGSATPSLESYHNAMQGKYALVRLTTRFRDIEMPEVRVVDVKDLQRRRLMSGPFSPVLLSEMRQALERGEQVILFQNRRGYSQMVECRQCGWVPTCTACDVSLTLHRSQSLLSCHYCGRSYKIPTECPNCGSTDLRGHGDGTEKIEDRVMEAFPNARVARMDLDTTRSRSAYERLISDFSSGRTNVLIGTQMVTKGLDFDRVSLVGILNADTMLNQPDFRAHERAFQMMQQVAGRAGRKGKRGLVILQTKNKDLPVISQVVAADYEALYRQQIAQRSDFHYPPLYRLVYIYLKHRHESVADTAAIELASRLRQGLADRVLGPDKPTVARVKDQNIRWMMLKIEPQMPMSEVRRYLYQTEALMMQDKRYASLQLYYDVDPN